MEIIIRKFSPIFIPRYEEISNQLPPFQLGCSRDPFSYYTYRKEFPTLSIRVYNFSFRTSFACFTLFFPSNPFPRPPSIRFTVKIHPPPLLPPGIHPGLLARQVENPNEILKVWDLIFKSVYLTFVCSCNATKKGYIANESENTNEINRNERVILFPLWLNWCYTDGESFFFFLMIHRSLYIWEFLIQIVNFMKFNQSYRTRYYPFTAMRQNRNNFRNNIKYVFNSYKKIYLENHERIDNSFY